MMDDFNKPWLFPENHFDFIHIRWVPGTVHDWKWLFEQAYRALKPGGWLESLDNDGFFRSDDGTMSETTATYDWKRIAIEGAKNMGLKPSICTVLDDLTRPAIDAAGFVNISETSFKVCLFFPHFFLSVSSLPNMSGSLLGMAQRPQTQGDWAVLSRHAGY